MNTQTTVNAVSQVNASNQRAVEQQAQVLVCQIRDEQKSIKDFEANIAISQAELKKLVDVTQESILGAALPTGNANATVIAEVIAKQQKAQVEGVASSLAYSISNRQNAIKACNERITEARKKLSELVAQTVTVDEIVGKK